MVNSMLEIIRIDKERGKLHEKRKVARKEESCRIRGKLQDMRKVARYEESCKINREDDRQTIRSTRSRFSCLTFNFGTLSHPTVSISN